MKKRFNISDIAVALTFSPLLFLLIAFLMAFWNPVTVVNTTAEAIVVENQYVNVI